MSEFPHEALEPFEAMPRITPEHAAEVIRLIDENGEYPTTPAIVIAVWTGGLVKYLIDDQQVEETIYNLNRAAKIKGKDDESS